MGGKLKEVVNGQQRTHSMAMWAQALIARLTDPEAPISPVIETAIATLKEEGVEPITWEEFRLMPVYLEELPEDATYEQREELFIKRGTTEIAQKTEHLADLAQSKLLELIGKWGIALATSKAITDAFTKNNVVLLDDDLTAFEGLLTGAQGRASFMLGLEPAQPDGTYAPSNTFFHLQWHKMPTGKYELNGYFG